MLTQIFVDMVSLSHNELSVITLMPETCHFAMKVKMCDEITYPFTIKV